MSFRSMHESATVTPMRRRPPRLSIVVPCFNEAESLPALLDRLCRLDQSLCASGRIAAPLHLLLIDDGSTDTTWDTICAARAPEVTGLRLSRNHGHQRALLAGLMRADGDVIVSMDADLQDDPEAIPEMIDRYLEGAEIVFGVRGSRDTDTAFKRRTARAYYDVLRRLGVDLVPDHADFRLMSRKALEALAEFGESNLFLRGLVPQLGFSTAVVSYDRAARTAGESKYPLRKMLALGLEGITSFSIAPLRVITVAGFLIALVAFGILCRSVWVWFTGGTVVGWASTVVPIYFLGGAHLIALGVIGEYIGKIYHETKRRPRFIIDEIHGTGASHCTLPSVEAAE